MIRHVVIENFKSLRRVELTLGRVNLFIGANASGKSNFLEALRVLQGIGNKLTISEALNGKPRGATSETWEGIRGGSARACFVGAGEIDLVGLQVGGQMAGLSKSLPVPWSLRISFSPRLGRVHKESFEAGRLIYSGDPGAHVSYYSGQPGRPPDISLSAHRAVLGSLATGWPPACQRGHVKYAGRVTGLLTNTQTLELSAALLRRYADVQYARRMGDRGENFAALVHTLCQDAETKEAYLSWLRELRPEHIGDVDVLLGAVGEPLFMLRENGREFPAPVLSDGTLRFAALAAVFFQPDMPSLVTIEEIENGLHPSRLRLLLELLRSQAERRDVQVIATTHSPRLLEWLEEEEYATTFFCRRDEETGATEIRPLTEVPDFMDVVRKPDQRISDLFAEGWFEGAL